MNAGLSVRGMRAAFGKTTVLHGVSLEVTPGETLVLFGASCVGKTVLLRAVAGFEQVTEGVITLAGRRIDGLPPARRNVAMAFEGYALARDADLHLLDEPMGQLEPQLRAILRGRVKALTKARGLTSVLVTHDQTEANAMADRIAVMEGGVLQQYGAAAELRDRPANLFVATFPGRAADERAARHDRRRRCAAPWRGWPARRGARPKPAAARH